MTAQMRMPMTITISQTFVVQASFLLPPPFCATPLPLSWATAARHAGTDAASGMRRRPPRAPPLVCQCSSAVPPQDKLRNLDEAFAVLKRAFDETPFHVRDEDGSTVPVKMLNQRSFLRTGELTASRHMFPAIELLGTDALALLEGLETVCPSLNVFRCSGLVQWSSTEPIRFAVPGAPVHLLVGVQRLFPEIVHHRVINPMMGDSESDCFQFIGSPPRLFRFSGNRPRSDIQFDRG